MRLSPGMAVGPYEISGAIGAGGMGEVYSARDTRLGRQVALKVLPRDVTADPERRARFEREARSSSALNHPNIVTTYDFASADGDFYLVMELIRGESLRDILSRGPVSYRQLLSIASGIADGLAAAHAAGLIHRDLKPENVMVTADGVPKILDFGLVKNTISLPGDNTPTEPKVTQTGTVLGTAMYMAPEQARGQELGIQADQFSLGLILHEMATGQHPFRRANGYETVAAILNDEPPPLGEAFPEPFAWIVERCLAKEPRERWASTADLARDVAQLRDRTSATRVAPRSAISRRRWALAIAAVALMAPLAIWLAVRRPAPVAAPLYLAIPTPQIALQNTEVAVTALISPDGGKLLATGTGASGTNDLWLYDLRSGTSRLLVENAFAPAWSNDSTRVVFFAEGKLKTMALSGGSATIVCDALPEGTPSWYGDVILFPRYSGPRALTGIYRVSASGGRPERLSTPVGLAWWPHFLPGGEKFLYMALKPGTPITHDVTIGSLNGPSSRIATIASRTVYADGHLLFVRDGTLLAQPFDIRRARLTGEAKRLVDGVDYFRSTGTAIFNVSDNGVLVWRTAKRPTRLVWLDRNGVELGTVGTAIYDIDGRFSPDGKRYAVGMIDPKLGLSDLWVYDFERDNAERVTVEELDQKAPIWSLDGTAIYYRSDGFGGPPDIARLQPGTDKPTLVYRGSAVEHPEDLSPDGKRLLFTRSTQVDSDIYVLPLDPPGEPYAFATTPFNEMSARFSPDGKLVAYSSNISGRPEVYVRPLAATAPAVKLSKDGGTRPRWSRSGTELFFLGPHGRMMAVAYDGSFGAPRMLFQSASAITFDPAPDGNRFLVQLDERRDEPSVQVLVNWTALLQ